MEVEDIYKHQNFELCCKSYVHFGKCEYYNAAALFVGITPDVCTSIGDNYRDVRIYNEEVKRITKVLCNGSGVYWGCKRSIFSLVNKAIENNNKANKTLLNVIKNFLLNLSKDAQKKFIKDYVYIARELNLNSQASELPPDVSSSNAGGFIEPVGKEIVDSLKGNFISKDDKRKTPSAKAIRKLINDYVLKRNPNESWRSLEYMLIEKYSTKPYPGNDYPIQIYLDQDQRHFTLKFDNQEEKRSIMTLKNYFPKKSEK